MLQYVQLSVEMLAEHNAQMILDMLTSSYRGQVRPPSATSGKHPNIHHHATRPATDVARIRDDL
jgi:hypothetical protein